MADKCIGKLTLDTTGVRKSVEEVNQMLADLGVGEKINISSKVTAAVKEALKEVTAALDQGQKKIVETAEKASKAIESIGKTKFSDKEITRSIEKTISLYEKLQNAKDKAESLKITGDQNSVAYAKATADIEKYEQALSRIPKAIREEAQARKEYDNIINKSVNVRNAAIAEEEAKQIEQATQAYIRMQKAKAEVANLESKGMQDTEQYAKATMVAGQATDAWMKYSQSIREVASASKEAKQAMRDLGNIKDATKISADTKEIERATQAYVKMLEARSKLRQLESQGKQGTEEYAKAAKASGEAYDAFMRYSKGAREAAKASEEAKRAMTDLSHIEHAVAEGASTGSIISRTEEAYKRLTLAIREYTVAKKAGNDEQVANWQQQIDGAMGVLNAVEQMLPSLRLQAGVQQHIVDLIAAARTQQDALQKGVIGTGTATNELASQLTSLATRYFSIMAVIRAITSLMKNTVEYVSEYSAKMTEIQMITLKTDEEVAELADKYRDMAQQMSVSSLEMADAAIYFTRQGLLAGQIEDRLKNVTMYAKAANVEFRDASEIITAVVNSMGLLDNALGDGRTAAERVADVFLKVGDSAATSGQEIGEAMQKAAASAGAFGVEFEWLAAYIATVSETTRQEARTIGTAFNTIIARLHQIKQQGYNSEDETKINDIAKALSKIDIALMDQYGNWRDMDTILQEIAAKWGDLDGKTKSYIATTMAGVKQQNVFLALMNDMSKGANNGSRAFELYQLAIDSAGTSAEKYAVYLDSVEASQERLTVAQEKFYSLLDDSVVKTWNNFWAGLLNNITSAADRSHGLTLIVPIVSAGLIGLTVALTGMNAQLGHTVTLMSMIEAHPVMMALAAAAAVLAVGVTALGAAFKDLEYGHGSLQTKINETKESIETVKQLQEDSASMFEKLGDKVNLTSDDFKDYNGLLDDLASLSPRAADAVEKLKNNMMDQKEAAEILNEELEKTIRRESEIGMIAMKNRLGAWTPDITNGSAGIGTGFNWELLNNGDAGMAGFGRQLNTAFYNSLPGYPGSENATLKVSDAVKAMIEEEYKNTTDHSIYDSSFNMTQEESNKFWKSIAYKVWNEYLVGEDFNSVEQYITQDAEKLIDDVVQTVGNYLEYTDFEKGVLGQKLRDSIFGSDGILSIEEWENSGNVLFDFMQNVESKGSNAIGMSQYDKLEYMFGNLGYGKYKGYIQDNEIPAGPLGETFLIQLRNFKNSPEYDEVVQEVVDVYQSLLEAGFSDTELTEMYQNTNIEDWVNMAKNVSENLKTQIKQDLGIAQLGILEKDENGKYYQNSLMWDQLDVGTLRKIAELTATGEYGADTFHDMMVEANGDVDVFKEKLDGLKPAAEEAAEGAKVAFKDFMKGIKEYGEDIEKIDGYVETLKKGTPLKGEDMIELFTAHPEMIQYADDVDMLREKLIQLREDLQAEKSGEISDYLLNSEDFFAASPFAGAKDKNGFDITTFQEYKDVIEEDKEAAVDFFGYLDSVTLDNAIGMYLMNGAETILQATEKMEEAADTWLAAHKKVAELNAEENWAKSNGYIEQVAELQRAMAEGGPEAALKVWNEYDESLRESISETYPSLMIAMADAEEALQSTENREEKVEAATQKMNTSLGNTRKYLDVKYFKNTADAMLKLEKGTISAKDAYDVFYKEVEKVTKAGDEIVAAQAKIAEGTELETSDVDALASLLGKTTDEVLQDFPAAVAEFDNLTGATGELRTMLDDLNKAAFIRITGVSEADFSNIEDGLLAVGDMAEDTIALLEATGQWKVERRYLDGEMATMENGSVVRKELKGYQDVLVATGKNPYAGRGAAGKATNKASDSSSKSSSGGGGGGGGSNRSGNEMTEVERMLDIMSQVNSIQGTQRSYYQAQQNYYSQTGQLQGVIGYMQKEQDVLENQNVTLEENIRRIEAYMDKKRAELAALSTSDEKYEEVADDLDKLQQAHQDYTAQLVNNKTAIESLTKAMDEQRKKIRTMEINLRNTILQAIKDREEKIQNMLNAEVQMENTIFDLIKKRYEKERDQIIETTNMKIDALQKERDLLDEQLRIRKEQAEEEDKALELQKLEAQYQRIIADPTRAKEAQKIRTQIEDLREEMAWDLAEKEVKAQQDSIDQQITSLEDYEEYIENYYEDLFEHPQKLIEEMREVMAMTHDEIIEWLMANNEEYQNSSENTQKIMLQGWENTYNEMKGILKTYWDEVEEIIAQGDDYIIEFLKNNSKAYAEAGKLQAEAYVDEWKKQLTDLHLAYQQVSLEVAADYDTIQKAIGDLTSSGGGGGGGSGSGSGSASIGDFLKGVVSGLQSISISGINNPGAGGTIWNGIHTTNRVNTKFATGGIADFSGPAWLDGSPNAPERVLSPYQTSLFESMVEALEQMSTISVAGMPNMGNVQTTGGSPVSVGDIVVNVDNLDTDDDYEELAQKVSEILMDRIGKTAVVGGLRIRSI